MPSNAVNQYGDTSIPAGSGHGIDIASQRIDDLDAACLAFVQDCLEFGKAIYAADIGCGHASFALRMARLGAVVDCLDIVDQFGLAKNLAMLESLTMKFHIGDIQTASQYIKTPLSAVLCQRTIHYLPFLDAAVALGNLRERMLPGGKLFISASGLLSELGTDYVDAHLFVEKRHAKLSPALADKHKIFEPVCLYTEQDMCALLALAGFTLESIYTSPFGNIKAIAKNG